jgi:hypothetical protein
MRSGGAALGKSLFVQLPCGFEQQDACRPEHDHRFGPCTLPGRINADTAPINRPSRGCYWVVTDHFASMVHNGCRDCTGYYFRREDRRRSRHEARRELHAYYCYGGSPL